MRGVVTRALFVRALAGTTAIALLSLWLQAPGLIGNEGILPFPAFLDRAWANLGLDAYWRVPTVLWVWPTETGLSAVFALALALCGALVVGTPVDGALLLLLWVLVLSVVSVFQQFANFQWDSLLLEALFVAVLWSPILPGPVRPPPFWARWLAWWMVFKLFFFGGLVKLTSGDPTWRDGTALTYHYWTQPLPNPVSWYADRLPGSVHEVSVWLTLVVELVLPFGLALGVAARRAVFGPLVALMALLALTGNYGYFQLLSAVCCLTLLDDALLRRWLPRRFLDRVQPAEEPARHIGAPIAVLLFATSLLFAWGFRDLPEWGKSWARGAHPFRTANSYGLFAVMTTERPVIVFEISEDGRSWEPLWLPHQTGPLDRIPGQVAPHMPRLDWQLWFAALGDCRGNPWVLQVQKRLAEGSGPVWGLFDGDPPAAPPRFVRTSAWSYRFAEPGSPDWWVREGERRYCPVAEAGR